MDITLSLSDIIVERLRSKASEMNISVDELAGRLFSMSLLELYEPNGDSDALAIAHLKAVVSRIREMPIDHSLILPATLSIDEAVAFWVAQSPAESDPTPAEWDRMWAAFEAEQKAVDLADSAA